MTLTADELATAATSTSIPGLLRHWAAERPEHLFLWCDADRMTFREADQRSDRVAAGLAELGLTEGEHVAIISPNRQEMLEIYLGAAKTAAIQVPFNIYLKGRFLRDQLIDSAASTLITDEAGCRAVAPLLHEVDAVRRIVLLDGSTDVELPAGIEVLPYEQIRTCDGPVPEVEITADTPMSILYTSGTTGAPKGCLLTHGYYVRLAAVAHSVCEFGDHDVIMSPLPLFHGAARTTCVGGALFRGITAVIEPAFHGTFLARAAETGATVLFGVGTMNRVLLAQKPSELDQKHRVRMAVWGPPDADAEQQIKQRFGFEVMSQVYGQTECGYSTFAEKGRSAQPGSAGWAAPDLEIAVVDDDDNPVPAGEVGEIVFRPRHRNAMFRGYWNKPEVTLQTLRGLWYHTGDFGRLHADGSMFFVDRKKDYLRRRGENVSSLELEAAIRAHPGVADVAVHNVPSELGEDEIKACIVAVDGTPPQQRELFEFFAQHLPYFAIPRYVELLDELPTNAIGRVLKYELRERGISPATWDLSRNLDALPRAARR